MLRLARVTFGSLIAFAIVVAATGWLYLIQPHSKLPGPPVADSLPLDELSRPGLDDFLHGACGRNGCRRD